MLDRSQMARRLERFSAARRRLANAAFGYRLAAWAALATLLALALLAGWLPHALANLAVAGLFVLGLLGLAIRYVWRRERFRSHLHEAFEMEALAEDPRSRLVSAWDFLDQPLITPLTQVVIDRAEEDLRQAFEQRLDRQGRNRRRVQCLALVALAIAVGLTPWLGFGRALATLRHSWMAASEMLFPVNYALEPGPDDRLRQLGESFDLAIVFDRPAFTAIELVLAREGAEPTTLPLTVAADGRASFALTSDIEAVYTASFRFGERESEPMELVFTTAPELINMQTELIYPGYTRLLPRTLEGIQQTISAVDGTRLTLGFTFSKELGSATLTWDDGTKLPLDVVGRYASTGLMLASRQASVQAKDLYGLPMAQPVIVDLTALPDQRPEVRLPRHLKDEFGMEAEIAKIFGFGVEVKDDFGVARCVLEWQRATTDNPNQVLETGEVERLVSPPRRKALVNFDNIFANLDPKPGDLYKLHVVVYDNRTPQAQSARSPVRAVFIYQADLDSLKISELGFGQAGAAAMRLAKARRATTVKQPAGQRTQERIVNEYEAKIEAEALAPRLRGEYRQTTSDYFRALSGAKRTASEEQP